MKVAIVGGGLVGRLAGWAAMQTGHVPTIFDRVEHAVSPRGFVYLHENCDLPMEPRGIHVRSQGNHVDYATKVYGDPALEESVSFGKYDGFHYGYSPAEALNILNGLQHGMVEKRLFKTFDEILQLRESFERVVFTLPISNFFLKLTWPSRVGCVGAWKLNWGEDLKNFCIYNSNPSIPWYRSGSMFGWAFREFAYPIAGHRLITKVLPGDGLISYKNVLRTGRFGKWDKTQLSTQSYREVLKWLS